MHISSQAKCTDQEQWLVFAVPQLYKSITSLNDLQCGDHINAHGLIYDHHMIVVAVLDETSIIVIHKRKDSEAVAGEEVDATPSKLTLLVYESPYSREEIIHRARQ